MIADWSDCVWNDNAGHRAASECIWAYVGDGVSSSIVGYSGWDNYVTKVVGSIGVSICVCNPTGIIAVDIVVYAADLKAVGGSSGWQQEGQKQEGKA